MKELPGNNEGAQWSSKLLDDLSFIKKHLRYPLNKKTAPPAALLFFASLFGVLRGAWLLIFIGRLSNAYVYFTIPAVVLTLMVIAFARYYQTLKFTAIPTRLSAVENMKLVEAFLTAQQLHIYRHPDAPELFQILGRARVQIKNTPIEIMIFIADDNRILINSHFTGQKWTINAPTRNYKAMANRLREWLIIHHPNASTAVGAGNGV